MPCPDSKTPVIMDSASAARGMTEDAAVGDREPSGASPVWVCLVVAQPDAEVVGCVRRHRGVRHDCAGVGAAGGVDPPAGGPGAEDAAVVAVVRGDVAGGELPYLGVGRWRGHRAVVEHGEHLGRVQRHRARIGRGHGDGLGGRLGGVGDGEGVVAVAVVVDATLSWSPGLGFTVNIPWAALEA